MTNRRSPPGVGPDAGQDAGARPLPADRPHPAPGLSGLPTPLAGSADRTTGRQVTVVALPLQVFLLTRSSLAVGLLGLAEVVPLMLFSVAAGAVVDRVDRRKLLVLTESGLAATSSLLLVGTLAGRPSLVYLYVVAALGSAIRAQNTPARSATVPNLVRRD